MAPSRMNRPFRLVELERDSSTGGTLPSHAIRTGDICRLQPLLSGSAKKKDLTESSKAAVEGVISRVRESSITLSLRTDEEIPFAFETRCWLYWNHLRFADVSVKLANEATFKRMRDTMTHLKDISSNELSPLARILLGQSTPSIVTDLLEIKFIDNTLNDSQKAAVRFSLSVPEIALIHGPPGVVTSFSPQLTIDWENVHSNRNHQAARRLSKSDLNIGCWTFEYFSRQSL
jgi:DNA polymerase alpha-associated DNA helicase A